MKGKIIVTEFFVDELYRSFKFCIFSNVYDLFSIKLSDVISGLLNFQMIHSHGTGASGSGPTVESG